MKFTRRISPATSGNFATANFCPNEWVGQQGTIVSGCACTAGDLYDFFPATLYAALSRHLFNRRQQKETSEGFMMGGFLSSRARGWRGEEFVHRRKVAVALLYGSLLAELFICASAGNAHANTGALAKSALRDGTPKTQLARLPAVRKRSAIQGFMSGFPEPLVPTIVNRRVDLQALGDITGSVPVLRLVGLPAKSILAAKSLLFASLTPKATVAPSDGENGGDQRATMVGIASTYDPIERDGSHDSGGLETASGELYDEEAWTAAIRTDLRDRFGGVRCGTNYQAAYALVEAGNKRIIVRINDVGPLVPGRIIDLNQRAMRYFDPTRELGLIKDVHVTPLPGPYWTEGPLGGGGETMRLAVIAAR